MKPLPLPVVPRKKILTLNSILGKRRRAHFNLNENDCVFKFTQPRPSVVQKYFFKVKLSDYFIWIGVDRLPALEFFAKEFKDVVLDRLPEDIRVFIFEAAMDKLFTQVESALGVALSLETYQEGEPEELFEESFSFTVKSEVDGQRYRGAIYVDRPGMEFLAALIERSRPVMTSFFNDLRVPVRLIIGQQMLNYEDYKAIEPNDILLFNGYDYIEDGQCVARFGRKYNFNAIFKDGKVTLGTIMDEETAENENMPKEPSEAEHEDMIDSPSEVEGMEEEEEVVAESASEPVKSEEASHHGEDLEAEEDPEQPHPLGKLPVKLVFEVGRRTIPLDELKSLQDGFVFELMNSADKPVTIRANGQVVGTGELLEIDGKVGVRVAKFHK